MIGVNQFNEIHNSHCHKPVGAQTLCRAQISSVEQETIWAGTQE